ncbi:MAG: Biosynthetic arginine decarboxylase [uncultured Chloroflexia bacterium]|uniref:arginine decarboxylase n=1 Tax=uncultured Chloroflexia bacterium TaxID=1672391 RepID=A0A6J4JDW8_9CHLR|nr:MAG: Biosynthetic arginine decarboxylase [uncultured Chloroflexia bacterium]
MTELTYGEYLGARYGVTGEGPINGFISRRDGRLMLADRVDLHALVERYGAPLEVAYLPLITHEVERVVEVARAAQRRTGYSHPLLYAYATKANFAEEVVRTALAAGAHYETSSTTDLQIATRLWQAGELPRDRWIFCNGSKEEHYLQAIARLRLLGHERLVAVLDDLDELETLSACPAPLQLGVRARQFAKSSGGDRFGLLPDEIDEVVDALRGTRHQLVLYHAMVGSQIEDEEAWILKLTDAVEAYCALWREMPSLRFFNFGGGLPTSAYSLDFDFDYERFFERLFTTIQDVCARHGVPTPEVVGEFGRYTVASHSLFLFEVGKTKCGRNGDAPWYLINGSLMVSAPDSVIVDDQQFIILPLKGWDARAQEVRIGGRRTCDSDDAYPRPGAEPLVLPETEGGLIVGVFGVGAYQQMLAGRGGAHHCLNPEMRRIVIEEGPRGLTLREVGEQSLSQIMRALGYNQPTRDRRRAPLAAPGRRRGESPRPHPARSWRHARQPEAPAVWRDG